ncbi:uncharacterized protein LOC106134402 [Amyelois transitella]|uniref:uncharacterized protein LOC106134402 n=1 Tax=Amyelois transitella TaxID=680683 RepID=UPI00298F81A6|nr:uncharacterized protein LOC106134402 [Amyelois transitella]
MGAKSPVKPRLRRGTFKCNICQRKLLSAQALKTHQYSIHNFQACASSSKAPDVAVEKSKTVSDKVSAAITKVAKPMNKLKQSNNVSVEGIEAFPHDKVSDLRKIQFECPICNEMSSTYYIAYKHIQNCHCINSKGQKVSRNNANPNIVKPVRVETCIKCDKRVRANDMHICHDTPAVPGESGFGVEYLCMGCKQKFGSVQLFDMHVSGLHSDGVESLFFPDMNEFLSWKTHVQTRTKCSYLILGKCNLKQTYRCTYMPPSETVNHSNISHICPASIVVQEFTKGIQVHFYKKHHGHMCPPYSCPEKFKKYLITTLMQKKDSFDVFYDEKDLYCQFKVLLESIIVEAAKVKIDDLKLMLEKALEMTAILNNYDEDDDEYTYSNKKTLCEEQVTKALNILKGKRKADDNESESVDHKKKKQPSEEVNLKIVNVVSMAKPIGDDIKEEPGNVHDVDKSCMVKKSDAKKTVDAESKTDVRKDDDVKIEIVSSPRILRNAQIQSPSFNDSYKDFVDKNFISVQNTSKTCPKTGKYQAPMKMSPLAAPSSGPGLRLRPLSKLVDPKQIEEELAKDDDNTAPKPIKNITFDMKNTKDLTVKKIDPNKDHTIRTVDPKENKGPNVESKFGASKTTKDVMKNKGPIVHKEFIPKMKPKKQVMKTRIGQFKPSFSPKKSLSPKKSEHNTSIGKVKDIEYEVKEQENDCNILILKI